MNRIDLNGQVAVVTGGARGIGFAIARRLVESGAKVCLWDVDAAQAQMAAAQLGDVAQWVQVDITDAAAVDRAVTTTDATSGPVSILVNSAGIIGPTLPLDVYPLDEWRRVVDVNLHGTFHVNRAIVPGMRLRAYGRIVNVASVAGKEGNPNCSAYSAAKAGVIGLTKSLGKELAGLDIAVNCVTPAAARTPIFDHMTPDRMGYMLAKIPRGRFLEVDEAASMIAWLVSKENSFTTGSVFDLSGGRSTY